MKIYLDLLRDIRENGVRKSDRTGTGTTSVFGRQLRFDLRKSFPLLTTKELHLKSIIYELLWFLRGDTKIRYLNEHGVKIWDEWADDDGDLGPIYGYQWRSWPAPVVVPAHKGAHYEQEDERIEIRPIDQISRVVEQIKTNPDSRRLIVCSWNVADIDKMALSPCHCLFQFYVVDGKLSCQLYQRSADVFLGVPFNIASYALFTMMVAQVAGLEVGEFVHTFGDVHIYLNHFKQVDLQLTREPRSLPQIVLNSGVSSIFDFKYEDFTLKDYDPHPRIPAKVSV